MESKESIKEDVDLVNRTLNGDAKVERRLHDKYKRQIYFFIKRQITSKEEAEEVCQDVLRAVLEAMQKGKIKEPEKLSSFIYRVSSFKITDWIRERKNDQKMERFENGGIKNIAENAEEETMNEEMRIRLKKAWQKLNLETKRLLYLLYVHGLNSEEVGQYFGLSPDVIRKRAQRAKEKIRKEFSKSMSQNI